MARSLEGKSLINKLIASVTDFAKGEENFRICQQYVHSNLQYHRYMDTDSHKVLNTLNGVYEKFKVHSDTVTAQALEDKVNQFINAHMLSNQEMRSEEHYAVLSFLLEMSNNPTSQSFNPTSTGVSEFGDQDQFDWYHYLTEDLEPLQTVFSESSTDSEETLESESDTELLPVDRTQTDTVICNDSVNVSAISCKLVKQYWRGEQDAAVTSATNFAQNWLRYQTFTGEASMGHKDTYMTEEQVVRELLWMVAGGTELFLLEFNAEKFFFSVRPHVNMTHTSKESLAQCLSPYLEFGSHLAELRAFCSDILKGQWVIQCRTLVAFGVAVRGILHDIERHTSTLISDMKTGDQPYTILSLSTHYQMHMTLLQIIYRLYTHTSKAILSQPDLPISQAAITLLTHCNEAINDCCTEGIVPAVHLSILKLFIMTMQPYVDIIDKWLTDGILDDPFSEFLIKKQAIGNLDETFWESSLEVTTNPAQDTMVAAVDLFQFSQSVPDIFEGILTKLTITGKSMEMLSGLGQLNKVLGSGFHETSLFKLFIKKLCQEISWSEDAIPSAETNNENSTDTASCISEKLNVSNLHILLRENLLELFTQVPAPVDGNKESKRLLDAINLNSMVHLSGIMSNALQSLIEERYHDICRHLLNVLQSEYKLNYYVTLARKLYFLEAGDILYDFCEHLFDKVKHQEHWADPLSLNINLKECLEKLCPKDSQRMSIYLTEANRADGLPIHSLERLNLHYEVEWPIDVIYNGDSELDYNKIFQFVIQLKLAKCLTDRLHFADLTEPLGEATHCDEPLTDRLYLLRMRILHFVNGLHTYIMTSVLHSGSLEFDQHLLEARDLDTIISRHKKYLQQMYDRCFLHRTATVIHTCILTLLNCCIRLQRLWDSGVHSISLDSVDGLAGDFNRHIQIFSSYINAIAKSGSVAHLESLALTLSEAVENL